MIWTLSKKWTESVSDEETELFWNVFFELLFFCWIDTVNNLYGSLCIMLQEFLKAAGIWTKKKNVNCSLRYYSFQLALKFSERLVRYVWVSAVWNAWAKITNI